MTQLYSPSVTIYNTINFGELVPTALSLFPKKLFITVYSDRWCPISLVNGVNCVVNYEGPTNHSKIMKHLEILLVQWFA